jgi:hypothetical protein
MSMPTHSLSSHILCPAEPKSRFGSLVVVYTHVGELTLDGEAIYFHESLAGAFSRAGFVVDSSGRRLLGVLDVIGMFNMSKEILPLQLQSFAFSYTA